MFYGGYFEIGKGSVLILLAPDVFSVENQNAQIHSLKLNIKQY